MATKKAVSRKDWWKREGVAVLWTIAFIIFLRAYILEPFVIPSESMVPTLLVGDHVFVAKGAYDFKIPLTNWRFLKVSDPHRGDVVVFDYPIQKSPDAGKFFVKRVIGVPGDKIEVRRGNPIVNGGQLQQSNLPGAEAKGAVSGFKFDETNLLQREIIPGAREPQHWVQRAPRNMVQLDQVIQAVKAEDGIDCIEVGRLEYHGLMINEICPFQIPENKYFVMGDNRDNSSDGRVFGLVDRSLLKGRVLFIWFSPPLPEDRNPYMEGPSILAALKDMIPGLFRMLRDPGRLSRVGDVIR